MRICRKSQEVILPRASKTFDEGKSGESQKCKFALGSALGSAVGKRYFPKWISEEYRAKEWGKVLRLQCFYILKWWVLVLSVLGLA